LPASAAELAALRPEDIDLDACTVRVTRQIDHPPGGGHSFGPPKSKAGRRVVPFPDLISPDLHRHLDGLGPSAVATLVAYASAELPVILAANADLSESASERLQRSNRIQRTIWFVRWTGSTDNSILEAAIQQALGILTDLGRKN